MLEMSFLEYHWDRTGNIDIFMIKIIYRLNKEHIGCKERYDMRSIKNVLTIAEIANIDARFCPICGIPLEYYEFIQANLTYNLDWLEKIWNDIRIQIPCCKCLNLVRNINIGMSIQWGSVDGKKKKKNLKKWGIIE